MWSLLPGMFAFLVFSAAIIAVIGVALFCIGYGAYRLFHLRTKKKPRAHP